MFLIYVCMKIFQLWWNNLLPQGKEEMLTTIPFARPQDAGPSVAIVTKVNRIQDQLVKKHDIELHMHLNRLEIAPQIYGMSVFISLGTLTFFSWSTAGHKCSKAFFLSLAGGFVCCLAGNFLFRTCWWCGMPFLLIVSLWTLWTTSLWPCCSISEMLVRTIYYLNNPIMPCVVFVACNFVRHT